MDEVIEAREIGGKDPEQVVRLTRERPGADDLGARADGAKELGGMGRDLAAHLNLYEGLHVEPEFRRLDPRGVLPDEARCLQALSSPTGLRGGEPERLAKLMRRELCIALKGGEKPDVCRIKGHHDESLQDGRQLRNFSVTFVP